MPFTNNFNRLFPARGSGPAVYTTIVASAGTLAWGVFVAGRKISHETAYGVDMSAVSGTAPVVKEARFRVYDMDEHLACRADVWIIVIQGLIASLCILI